MEISEMCKTEGGGPMMVQNDLSQKLSRERGRLESRLEDIKQAEELLEKNPTLKDLFNVVARIRHL